VNDLILDTEMLKLLRKIERQKVEAITFDMALTLKNLENLNAVARHTKHQPRFLSDYQLVDVGRRSVEYARAWNSMQYMRPKASRQRL
jgi:hypothetical protein